MSDRNYNDRYSKLRHVSKRTRDEFLSIPKGLRWTWIGSPMIESPAYQALTLAARRILDRLLIEQIEHAGRENGRLKVSYTEFEKFGVDRHAIRGALDELMRLGFIACASPGRRSYGSDPGRIATYRLNFYGVVDSDEAGPPTNDWERLSDVDVRAIQADLKQARALKKGRRPATAQSAASTTPSEVIPFSPKMAA